MIRTGRLLLHPPDAVAITALAGYGIDAEAEAGLALVGQDWGIAAVNVLGGLLPEHVEEVARQNRGVTALANRMTGGYYEVVIGHQLSTWFCGEHFRNLPNTIRPRVRSEWGFVKGSAGGCFW
jgi:hypothetical protein